MLTFEFNNFPTHVKLSSRVSIKINTQNIFNGKLHTFSRAKAVEYMKNCISQHISNISINEFPAAMFMEIHVPYNYGDVRLSKGEIKWRKIDNIDLYEPKNDLDNMSQIWSKCFQDCLVSKNVIPNDTIKYISMLGYKYVPCNTLDDRKIVVSIIPISEIRKVVGIINNSNILDDNEMEIVKKILKL